MKGTRRIILCLLILSLLLMLGGCGTRVAFYQKIDTAGARTMQLTVSFDETATQQEKDAAYQYLQQVQKEREQTGRDTRLLTVGDDYVLEETYDSATDYYIAMGLTGNEPAGDPLPSRVVDGYFLEYRNDLTIADRATVLSHALRYAVCADVAVLFAWRDKVLTMAAEPNAAPVYATLAATDSDRLVDTTISFLEDEALCDVLQAWLCDRGYDLADVAFGYSYDHLYDSVYAKQYDESYETTEGTTVYVWHMTLADVPYQTVTVYQKTPRRVRLKRPNARNPCRSGRRVVE